MRRLVMLSIVLIGFGVLPGPASALPAPMSQEQLLEKSDLVGLVRIKSVTCTGGLLGPWTVYYYPGEMVWTHLVGATTTWWNGRGDVVSKAVITELPTKPG